jgi:hypothetical protein
VELENQSERAGAVHGSYNAVKPEIQKALLKIQRSA